MTKYYLAIDIGASSGRHIVGWKENNEIKTTEIYRFANGMDKLNGHLVWDVKRLFREIKHGLKIAFEQYEKIESMAIDSWAVDYVLMKNGEAIIPCYAYRDGRTESVINSVHEIVSFDRLYSATGIQFQPFNTIYQLMCDKKSGRLDNADSFLMIPEYLAYLLTGKAVKEYTNATSTGLVNAQTKEFDKELIDALDLPEKLFTPLNMPGTIVGQLSNDVAKEVGGQVTVKLCPTHDTASAFYAVDNEEDSVLISSGTWALVGAKIDSANTSRNAMNANFTNEGGVNNIRFLKNITGMWINVCLKNEFGKSFDEMTALANLSTFDGVFDVNDKLFSLPDCMSKKIVDWFVSRNEEIPSTEGDIYRCAYRSMAFGYKKAVDELEQCLGRVFNKIYIVGGGANNKSVNAFTAEFTHKTVVALPIEATAIGNLKSQIEL